MKLRVLLTLLTALGLAALPATAKPLLLAADTPSVAAPAPAGTPNPNTNVNVNTNTSATKVTDGKPDKSVAADNTGKNTRDRNNATLTPMDQGNDKADVEMTRKIRKEVVAIKSLSTNGHNVKIITNKGKVTLRGPVDSEDERRQIVDIAKRAATAENVHDQLEVKVKPSK